MATASSEAAYYCHVCQTNVVPNLQDYTCSFCQSGFIECVSRENATSFNQPEPDTWQTLARMLGDLASSSFSAPLENIADSDSSEEEPSQVLNAFRRMRHGGRRSNPRFTREHVSTFGSDHSNVSTRIQLSSNTQPFRISVSTGRDGRYQFDQFITILMNGFQSGHPPATESAINALPTTVLTKDKAAGLGECSICFDNFKESDTLITLPCEHFYHRDCLTTWLKQHGTCPVCRKDLTGRDSTQTGEPSVNPPRNSGPSSSFF